MPSEVLSVKVTEPLLIVDARYRARSAYVESFWLPVLGPTATWLLRVLGGELEHRVDGYVTPLQNLAVRVGCAKGWRGSGSTLIRSLGRLDRFFVDVHFDGDTTTLRLPLAYPPVSRHQLRSVDTDLMITHQRYLETEAAR